MAAAVNEDDDSRPTTTVRWHRVYLLITAFGFCIVGLAWSDVLPGDVLSGRALATLVIGLFAVASVLHWYDATRNRRRLE